MSANPVPIASLWAILGLRNDAYRVVTTSKILFVDAEGLVPNRRRGLITRHDLVYADGRD